MTTDHYPGLASASAMDMEHTTHTEDFVANREMVPYVGENFLGCDVVMNDNQIIELDQAANLKILMT